MGRRRKWWKVSERGLAGIDCTYRLQWCWDRKSYKDLKGNELRRIGLQGIESIYATLWVFAILLKLYPTQIGQWGEKQRGGRMGHLNGSRRHVRVG